MSAEFCFSNECVQLKNVKKFELVLTDVIRCSYRCLSYNHQFRSLRGEMGNVQICMQVLKSCH